MLNTRHTLYSLYVFIMYCLSFSNLALANEPVKTYQPSSINLEITTHLGDKQQFVENDIISFFISLDQSAYIYAFYEDASGNTFQLIPGKIQSNHLYQAGIYQPLPSENAPFKFFVREPFGKETIWIFASDNSSISLDNKSSADAFKQIKTPIKDIAHSIKASSTKIFDRAHSIIYTRKTH